MDRHIGYMLKSPRLPSPMIPQRGPRGSSGERVCPMMGSQGSSSIASLIPAKAFVDARLARAGQKANDNFAEIARSASVPQLARLWSKDDAVPQGCASAGSRRVLREDVKKLDFRHGLVQVIP